MPWRLRLTDLLGRTLRRWQLKRRRLNSGVAKTALADALAMSVPGRWLKAPPARRELARIFHEGPGEEPAGQVGLS